MTLVLSGCVSNEKETEQVMAGTHIQSEIQKDNGRHVTMELKADGESGFRVDADVVIPDSEIRQGILQAGEWDISKVTGILCPDVPVYPTQENQQGYILYKGGDTYKELDYDTALNISQLDGSLQFSNYKLDDYFVDGNYSMKDKAEWTDEERQLVQNLEQQAADIFIQIGLESQLKHTELFAAGHKAYCMIRTVRCMDGYLLMNDDGTMIYDSMFIAECGINEMNISCIYEAQDAASVSVLSLDEILEIVEEGVKKKNINPYMVNAINRIELVYMTEIKDGALRFFPAWCFIEELDGVFDVTVLCIDARNGAIAYLQEK